MKKWQEKMCDILVIMKEDGISRSVTHAIGNICMKSVSEGMFYRKLISLSLSYEKEFAVIILDYFD